LAKFFAGRTYSDERSLLFQGVQELKFKYIEDDSTDTFFLPYVWTLVHAYSQSKFDQTNIKTRITE